MGLRRRCVRQPWRACGAAMGLSTVAAQRRPWRATSGGGRGGPVVRWGCLRWQHSGGRGLAAVRRSRGDLSAWRRLDLVQGRLGGSGLTARCSCGHARHVRRGSILVALHGCGSPRGLLWWRRGGRALGWAGGAVVVVVDLVAPAVDDGGGCAMEAWVVAAGVPVYGVLSTRAGSSFIAKQFLLARWCAS
ncbi:hypothetical protein ACP4OV_007993 [Aristida adscensionis]